MVEDPVIHDGQMLLPHRVLILLISLLLSLLHHVVSIARFSSPLQRHAHLKLSLLCPVLAAGLRGKHRMQDYLNNR